MSRKIAEINNIIDHLFCPNVSPKISPLSAAEIGAYFNTTIYKIKLENVTLLCKLTCSNKDYSYVSEDAIMFANELLFYTEYVPELTSTVYALIPKFFYGNMQGVSQKPCIIIEFLDQFRLSENKIFLPTNHIEMALQHLGEFHGLGFVMKETKPDKFIEICSRIMEIRYRELEDYSKHQLRLHVYLRMCAQFVFNHLPNMEKFGDKLETYRNTIEGNFHDFNIKLMTPRNHLSILCHGDYTVNNILFAYNENNEPISVKMIDFQMIRHAQPGTDLAVILALHTDPEDRFLNLEKYLQIYHNAVLKIIQQDTSDIDISKYSYDNFLRDYATHSFIGFFIISIFMPLLDNCDTLQVQETIVKITTGEVDEDKIFEFFETNKVFSDAVLGYAGKYLEHCIDLFQQYGDNKIFE